MDDSNGSIRPNKCNDHMRTPTEDLTIPTLGMTLGAFAITLIYIVLRWSDTLLRRLGLDVRRLGWASHWV